MVRSENVETPLSGAKAVCPDKAPFPGLVLIARVTMVFAFRMVLPATS
jgi:hypothetical protein